MANPPRAPAVPGIVAIALVALADLASADLHKCDAGAWFSAARAGVLKDIRACMLGGADVEMRNAAGCTATHAAASNGHFDVLKLLRERGAAMDVKCANTHMTPLMLAAKHGDFVMVKYLLNTCKVSPLDARIPDGPGDPAPETAVTYAAQGGHLDIAVYLHQISPEFLPTTGTFEDWSGTFIMWSASHGDPGSTEALAKSLKADGAHIDDRDSKGFTAVLWASVMGQLESIQVLVKYGADLTMVSPTGLTTLMAAAYFGHDQVTSYLLKEGVHPDGVDPAGWTAMHWAAAGGATKVLAALLDSGASPSSTGGGGWDPLMVAALSGRADAAAWLATHGADLDAANSNGRGWRELAADPNVIAAVDKAAGNGAAREEL